MRKNQAPAPIFFPFLHHRRQVFPLPLQNCRIPENKRKKGYPPLPFRYVQALTSLSMLGREFACRKLTALTGCQWFHAVSGFSQGKTRSNQIYMDVYLVAMPSVAVLNAYLRVHGSTSSLPRKFEVKEYTGRTFFNDDIHSGRKMVGIPPSHE